MTGEIEKSFDRSGGICHSISHSFHLPKALKMNPRERQTDETGNLRTMSAWKLIAPALINETFNGTELNSSTTTKIEKIFRRNLRRLAAVGGGIIENLK